MAKNRIFSKEGKRQRPQIVLGLLVRECGYPLAYDIFQGNTFEGHTLLPVLERFQRRYQMEHLVIVADAGMMSRAEYEMRRANTLITVHKLKVKNSIARLSEQPTMKKWW